LEKKIAQTEQKIEKMKLDMRIKDDLKTVALGTSKINYMDPRITVAWCKRHEVPIEKVSAFGYYFVFKCILNPNPLTSK
jgi:DNA topoisomerase-1